MFYLVLGIFVAVAFGALLKKQQTRQHPQPPQATPQEEVQAAPSEAPQEDRLEIGSPSGARGQPRTEASRSHASPVRTAQSFFSATRNHVLPSLSAT